jgi:hypothetical protein
MPLHRELGGRYSRRDRGTLIRVDRGWKRSSCTNIDGDPQFSPCLRRMLCHHDKVWAHRTQLGDRVKE